MAWPKPLFYIVWDREKKVIGPFENELEAKDYIGWKRWWPKPRVIQSVTTYGLETDNMDISLPGWTREMPDEMPRAFQRWRRYE